MRNKLMAGIWRYIIGVPPFLWEKRIEKAVQRVKRASRFMSPEHRLVHHFVVREMPRLCRPISAQLVAQDLGLTSGRVAEILQELESRLTFLWRNSDGEVTWAYPVTVEKTPHAITFDTGERLYAA
ncbi:MAG: hypothetical protein ACOYXY_19560 [Thermodesulfobacteriota bacterium]